MPRVYRLEARRSALQRRSLGLLAGLAVVSLPWPVGWAGQAMMATALGLLAWLVLRPLGPGPAIWLSETDLGALEHVQYRQVIAVAVPRYWGLCWCWPVRLDGDKGWQRLWLWRDQYPSWQWRLLCRCARRNQRRASS